MAATGQANCRDGGLHPLRWSALVVGDEPQQRPVRVLAIAAPPLVVRPNRSTGPSYLRGQGGPSVRRPPDDRPADRRRPARGRLAAVRDRAGPAC